MDEDRIPLLKDTHSSSKKDRLQCCKYSERINKKYLTDPLCDYCPKCTDQPLKLCNCKLMEMWCDNCGYRSHLCKMCGRVNVDDMKCPHYKGHPGPRIERSNY
jgi:hypothetical protein